MGHCYYLLFIFYWTLYFENCYLRKLLLYSMLQTLYFFRITSPSPFHLCAEHIQHKIQAFCPCQVLPCRFISDCCAMNTLTGYIAFM
jgi:hypothetical protein